MWFEKSNLNTSYVDIKQIKDRIMANVYYHLNTSYVDIKPFIECSLLLSIII